MNILFCPVGHDQHLDGDHWRIKRPENNYKIVVYQHSDDILDEQGYDYIFKRKGFKWALAKHFLTNIIETIAGSEEIEYVAFMDDDVTISYQDLNSSIEFAKENGMDVFQISMTPESNTHYTITRQDPQLLYTKTNFIEFMCPFLKYNDVVKILDFINCYDINHGWGLDFAVHQLLNKPLYVIHAYSMGHPPQPSSYNLSEGGAEFRKVISEIAPNYFREKRKEIWVFPMMTIFWEEPKGLNVWSFLQENI